MSKYMEKIDPMTMSEIDMESLFKKNVDGTLIILGHAENGRFVTVSATGQKGISIEFDKLEQLAERYNIQAIYLGCHSIGDLKAQWGGVGVIEEFKTLQAAQRLEAAFSKAGDMKEFLTHLSTEGFTIIVDPNAFANARRVARAGIYATVDDAKVRVAELGYVGNSISAFRTWVGDKWEKMFAEP